MRVVPVLAVVLAAAVPYLPTLDNYFAQDDFGVVWLLAGKPWNAFPGWFASTWMDDIWGFTPDEIRPFTAVTYQVSAWWGAGSPVANHVINIAFHAANGLLVLGIARVAAGLCAGAALFAAVVFVLLPMQAESVAWITGRVDSVPAFFYLGAFYLYVRWRGEGRPALYVASVALFFAALFSKQNAITLPAALLIHDLFSAGRAVLPPAPRWPRALAAMALPCVPFVVLTLGYLALRYALFGEVAREGLMTSERLGLFLGDASAHLRRMIVGDEARLAAWPAAAPVLGVAAAVVVAGRRLPRGRAGQLARSAVYFGVIWVGLGLAPTIVAGYASPRHMYLASVGWAILLAAAVDVLWEARRPIWRFAGLALAVLALAGYAFRLAVEVRAWEVRTDVSRRAVADLEREALAAPEGSLLIAGAPARSWNFALPFAARPPFARVDLTRRATIVSDSSLHCCPAHLWNAYTRSALAAWLADPRRPPVVGLFWDPDTGALSRVSDREEPFLRQVVAYWIATPDAAALDLQIRDTLERLVAGRRRD